MFDGPGVAAALKSCGITHVLWVPDSELGQWESALAGDSALRLIRVCREGEAIAVAGRIPAASEGSVEIRPVFELAGLPQVK